MTVARARNGPDSCPGVLRTHGALDGELARVRLPGGRLRADQLAVAAQVAEELGDGHIELTSRGNLQLRGLTDSDAAGQALLAAGLGSPGAADTVRNIVASPLAGRIGGHGGVDETVTELDDKLRGGAAQGLSGRFLFGVDDGRGDILAHRPDVVSRWRPDGKADLIVADHIVGTVARPAAAAALLTVAEAFAGVRGSSWRIRELDEPARTAMLVRVVERLDLAEADGAPGDSTDGLVDTPALVGWLPQDDGAVMLGALTPAGRLPARTAEFLAAVKVPILVTARREILLADLSAPVADTVLRVLAPMGLIFDADSPWTLLSCCAGAPGCAKSHTDVRADVAAHLAIHPVEQREHWVGCSRGCGSPTTDHVRVQAQPDGTYLRMPT